MRMRSPRPSTPVRLPALRLMFMRPSLCRRTASLRDAPNLVLTPHIGASTAEAQVAGSALRSAESLIRCLGDGDRSGAVNEAALG